MVRVGEGSGCEVIPTTTHTAPHTPLPALALTSHPPNPTPPTPPHHQKELQEVSKMVIDAEDELDKERETSERLRTKLEKQTATREREKAAALKRRGVTAAKAKLKKAKSDGKLRTKVIDKVASEQGVLVAETKKARRESRELKKDLGQSRALAESRMARLQTHKQKLESEYNDLDEQRDKLAEQLEAEREQRAELQEDLKAACGRLI